MTNPDALTDEEWEWKKPGRAQNLKAAERVVEALRQRERVAATDEALIQAFVSLALAVDVLPGDAQLWKQYREAIAAVRGLAQDDSDDDTAAWIAGLRTQMGDASKS